MDGGAQVRAILDKLRGVPTEDLPEAGALEEPWRTIYGRVRGCGDREEASGHKDFEERPPAIWSMAGKPKKPIENLMGGKKKEEGEKKGK